MPHMNLSQHQVPNECLTLEQLRHGLEKIGQLNEIRRSFEMCGLLDSGDMVMGGQMPRQQQAMMGGLGPNQEPHPCMMPPLQQQCTMQEQAADHNVPMEGSYSPGHLILSKTFGTLHDDNLTQA